MSNNIPLDCTFINNSVTVKFLPNVKPYREILDKKKKITYVCEHAVHTRKRNNLHLTKFIFSKFSKLLITGYGLRGSHTITIFYFSIYRAVNKPRDHYVRRPIWRHILCTIHIGTREKRTVVKNIYNTRCVIIY